MSHPKQSGILQPIVQAPPALPQQQRAGALIKQEQTAASPFLRKLFAADRAAEPLREAVIDTRDNARAVRERANQQFLLGLEKFTAQAEGAAIRGDESRDRLDTIDRMPNFMSSLLGIVDPDFNRRIQERNLSREQLEISRAATGLQTIQTRRATAINSAQFEREAAVEEFTFDRQDRLDTVLFHEAGIAVERNIRRKTVEFAQDRTIEELGNMLRDPTSVPSELQGKPGLIALVLNSKRAAKVNLSVVEFNLSTAKKLEDIRNFENSFNSVEEIDAFQGKFPPGSSNLTLQALKEKFVEIGTSIETMKLALGAKKTELFEASLTRMFSNMDSVAAEQMLKQARRSKDGKFDIGDGVKISAARIQTAVVAIEKREKEEATAREQNSIAIAGVDSAIMGSDLLRSMVPRVFDPTNPNADASSVPAPILAKFADFASRTENQKARIANAILNGDPTVGAMTSVLVDQLNTEAEFYTAMIEKRIENDYNPKERRGAREYFTSGIISTPNATELVVGVIGNASMFSDNIIIDGPWKSLVDVAQDTFVDKFANIDPKGGGLTITSGKPRNSIALEQAIKDSGFRAGVAQNVQMMTMAMATNQLIQEFAADQPIAAQEPRLSTRVQTKVSAAFESLRDPRTGMMARKYMTDNESFDMGAFLLDTAKMSDALQLSGDLPINVNIADMVFERARLGVDKTLEHALQGLYGTAIKSSIFQGKAINSQIKAMLDGDSNLVPQSVRSAQENRKSQERAIEHLAEQDPQQP